MKTVGIVAEYNPFHKGHEYQLAQAKALSGADYAVVVLGGDFTQRGLPALFNKYARCEMALSGGADLVLELPVCFSCGSAEYFATGAVTLLDSLGIDALCFGSEAGSLAPLQDAAGVLLEEPEAYRVLLRKYQKEGLSFPAARSRALGACLENREHCGEPVSEALLHSPNNILGIAYCKAARKRKSSMELYTVPRYGAAYDEASLPEQEGAFASAEALRRALLKEMPLSRLSSFLPQSSADIIERERSAGVLTCDDLSSVLFYRLLSLKSGGYGDFADVSEALGDKIANSLEEYVSFSGFASLLKSRDLTYTRICRSLTHILLDISESFLREAASLQSACYARILGFNPASAPLLTRLSQSPVPLISRPAAADTSLSSFGRAMFRQDLFASGLWEGIRAQKQGRSFVHEYRRQILKLPEDSQKKFDL